MWKNVGEFNVIPQKFTINGSTYNVEVLESSEKDLDGNLGDFTNLLHEIRIAKKACLDNNSEIEIPKDEITKTYLHELGHCFNYYYNNENSEEFANAFANFMYDYFRTQL